MRPFSAWLLLVAACACARPPEFVFEKRMGLVRWREGGGCLSAFNASIASGTRVVLVDQPASTSTSTDSASVTDGRIVESLPKACDEGLAFPNNQGVAPSFYKVATTGAAPRDGIMFAILDPPVSMTVANGRVEADLDGDGVAESFRVCNSAENVHFLTWTGAPAQGRPRWRGMYYVGYDMNPTCTDEDVAGMVTLDKRGRTNGSMDR